MHTSLLRVGALALGLSLLTAGCSATSAAPVSSSTPTAENTYSSDGFAVPFTVTVSALVAPDPIDPGHEQVTWESEANSNDRIRLVAPVRVFPPGSDTAIDPPTDYAAYLTGLADAGVDIADQSTVSVDGQDVPMFTVTGTEDINGSIGCTANVEKDEDDCFGIHPEYLLRVAVIPVDDVTVLAWARTDATEPNLDLVSSFESMLGTLHFE
jgi:hypothetical protein